MVLNGCDTTAVDSNRFVQGFNQKGVTAVIATQSKVPGSVAGHFLDCFAEAIGDTSESETISDAYLGALECLRDRDDHNGDPVGTRALTYTLLGDGSLPLCPPLIDEEEPGDETPNPEVSTSDYL